MEPSMVLRVVFPPGTGIATRDFAVSSAYSVGQALIQFKSETGLAADVLVVGEAGYLALGSRLRDHQFGAKPTLWLMRHEHICTVLCTQGPRRQLLVDYMAPVGEVILYLAVKLGVTSYDALRLHVYGSGEVLRNDRSLVKQGVTPNQRLFCLTVAKDERPLFPPDAVEQYAPPQPAAAAALALDADDAAAALNVPEESLVRASKRGPLQKLHNKKGKYQARYFVLQDADLYYYTEAKAKRAKNVLRDAVAAAAVADGSSKKKGGDFEFAVSAGEKTIRVLAKTADEGNSWISAINAAHMQRSAASTKGSIFRNYLAAAVKTTDGTEVPEVVLKCIEYLDKQSVLRTVGLFRLSGSAPLIKKLSDDVDAGKALDLAQIADPHTVTGLLKLYFREMSEPLLTWALYTPLTTACAVTEGSRADRVRYVRQVLLHLPPLHRATLCVLMRFLAKVASYADHNRMPLHNLATVFAPNILRCKDATMFQVVEASPLVNNAVITLLEYQDYLFGDGPFPVQQAEFPVRAMAVAHHAYASAAVGDLKLDEQDVVCVLAESADGWWYGECLGKYGRFPGSYVAKLDDKEAEKMRKKALIDNKILTMREQVEHSDKVLGRLADTRAQLQRDIEALSAARDELLRADFPAKARATAAAVPQFAAVAAQYREALQKMLVQTEQSASLNQELLIALNGLWSAANNPKLAKKYKKALTKIEPLLAKVREQVQKQIEQKRQTVEVRSDLIKDLMDIDRLLKPNK